MSTKNKYTPEFKKAIVNLYHSGKSYAQIHAEYGVSASALSKWIKLFSEVKIDDDTVITAQQIKELQKRNAMLEEENLILKKAIANGFYNSVRPHSHNGGLTPNQKEALFMSV